MSTFPDHGYDDCGDYGHEYFARLAAASASVDRGALHRAATLLSEAIAREASIFSCGNGGSAAIANHLACDCLKGIRTDTTIRPIVHSLSTTVELITAISNDISYDVVFSFQLESNAKAGDVLIAISSSGNSPNILKALRTAKDMGMSSIAMTGFSGGAAADLADVALWVKADNYGVVEDVHQSLMHILAQYLRQSHLEDPSVLTSRKF